MKRFNLLALFMVVLFPLFAQGPISKEAEVIDINEKGEVEMQATGIYYSPAEKKLKKGSDIDSDGIALAIEDAKKAAIYHLLFFSPSPILDNDTAKKNFENSGDFVYEKENVDRYVIFTDTKSQKTASLDDGSGLKVTTTLIVNRNMIGTDLANMGIFDSEPATKGTRLLAQQPTMQPQTPVKNKIERQKLRSAAMRAVADVPARSIVAITGVDCSNLSIDDIDLPDLLIDVLIELNYRPVDSGRVAQTKSENKLSNTPSAVEQISLGRATGATYILDVLVTNDNLRIQCTSVETGTIEGRGTVEIR